MCDETDVQRLPLESFEPHTLCTVSQGTRPLVRSNHVIAASTGA